MEKAYSQWLLSSTVMFINIKKYVQIYLASLLIHFFFLFQIKNTFSSVSSLLMIRLWQPLYNATSNKFCVTMFSSLCHVQQQTYIKCLFWNNTTHYLCIWNVINKNSKKLRSGIFIICERLYNYDMACVGHWMNKYMCKLCPKFHEFQKLG